MDHQNKLEPISPTVFLHSLTHFWSSLMKAKTNIPKYSEWYSWFTNSERFLKSLKSCLQFVITKALSIWFWTLEVCTWSFRCIFKLAVACVACERTELLRTEITVIVIQMEVIYEFSVSFSFYGMYIVY